MLGLPADPLAPDKWLSGEHARREPGRRPARQDVPAGLLKAAVP
ncbi:hypothetical protein QFZ24_009624 [Streptomyces phaeochromogenes]|nr:hypothetical protein [Streptomyces phaeochromogenes]